MRGGGKNRQAAAGGVAAWPSQSERETNLQAPTAAPTDAEQNAQKFKQRQEQDANPRAKTKSDTKNTTTKRASPAPQPASAKKKRIDAGVNPCHGMVYNGACGKAECPFAHHAGRCKAFKEAHPDGPPARR